MLSRRAVLQAGFAAGAGTLVSRQAQAHGVTTELNPSVFDPGVSLTLTKDLAAEYAQLRMFRKLLAGPIVAGVAVPFATIPINLYVRPIEQQQLSEPRIPMLHRHMMHFGAVAAVRDAVVDMFAIPKGVEVKVVDRLDLKVRGHECPQTRIISPRFSCDIEERGFSMRSTARMIIGMAEALNQECAKLVADTKARARPGTYRAQITLPKVSVILEAFMLEVMAWVNIADYGECPPQTLKS